MSIRPIGPSRTALDAAYRSVFDADRKYPQAGAGMVCFVFDDCHDDHYGVVLPAFEARAGRCSLAITTGYLDTTDKMTTAQVLDAFTRGHEMVAHSATHVDLTTRGTSARVTEYASKDTIEATIGVGNCRNYVAPFSSRNSTIDRELYSRFDNAFFGVGGQYVVPMNQQAPFQIGRFGGWLADGSATPAYHTRVLNLIRYAAKHNVRVVIYGHEVASTSGLTQAMLTEALDLCVSLGVPMVRLQDAFPRHHLLPDPTFEDASLLPWPGDGTRVTADPGGVAQTHALELSSTDGTTKAFLDATMLPAVGGRSFRYYAAIDTTVTSGAGGASLAMEEYDATGTLLARTLSTPIAATTAWQWTAIDKILAAATVNVKVGGTLVGVVGSARFSTPWPSESYQQLAATAVISAISSVTGVPQSFDRAGSSKANAVAGTHAWTQNSAAWRGGYRSINNIGDYAEWTATLKAGTYTLEAEILKANNGGFLTPTIGGGAAGGDIDTYNASNLAARVENTGLTIPSDGDYTIRFTVSGSKNASSAGNVCRLSGFSLARTGA